MTSTIEQILDELVVSAPAQLRPRFQRLLTDIRFRTFATNYSSTIQRKLHEAGDLQDAADVFAELETAARLLSNPSLDVEYEPYGKVGVDFRVHYEEDEFNAEIKRIRQTQATTTFDQCRRQIVSAICEIPSQLGISIECFTIDADPTFANRLHDAIGNVVHQACAAIKELDGKLQDGATETIKLDAFPDLQLRVTHVPGKDAESPTAHFGAVYPLLFTQKESRKYADRIFDAIKQFTEGIPNVLIFWSDSITHKPHELRLAIQEIEESIGDDEDGVFTKRGFKDTSDFAKRLRLMTAAVAVSQGSRTPAMTSRNVVWLHPHPETPLCTSVREWLLEL